MPRKEAVVINPAVKLKPIQHKVIWGGRPCSRVHSNNVVPLVDNEFVTIGGSGLMLFENGSVFNRKSKIIDCKDLNVLYVKMLNVTRDAKFLAAVVKLNQEDNHDITILIFHTKNHFQDFQKPRSIKYNGSQYLRPAEHLEVTALAFSPDNVYLAVATNIPSIGILVYEQFKGHIFQSIPTDSIVVSLSFHPEDSNKLLGTGDQNLIRFWKFTTKSVHIATITGLKKGNTTYTAHGWITPYAENSIVVGTSNGFVTTIQNCEQRVAAQQIFGTGPGNSPIGCLQILIRGDHVIVSSSRNLIVLFELRRIVVQKYMGLTVVMVPLKFYRFPEISRLCGLTFCFKESITAYSMVALTEESAVVLEMITDSDLSGAGLKKNDGHPDSQESVELVTWQDCNVSKILYQFHSGTVQSLSVSSRAKIFITSSFQDTSVRCWYYDDPSVYHSAWLIETYRDRLTENPFFIDLHPAGYSVAFACENEVREYAIGDTGLEIIRRFLIRNAFQGVGGVPVIINQPVSIVKYSQGGHLLVVVTGKVAQVFHLFHQDDEAPAMTSAQANSISALGPIENPYRLMVLLDHASTITDVTFFSDDKGIITTASDGSVYSWEVGATTRSQEYVHKGMSATHIAASKHLKSRITIIASFESVSADTLPAAAEILKRRRLSSFVMRRSASANSDSGSDIRGSKAGNDLAAMASAFLKEFEKSPSGMPGTPDMTKPGTASNLAPPPKPFIAVWTDQVSHLPKIIYVDAPVRSIAIGRAGYPDPYDLTVLGLADGRILFSMLPIPCLEIVPSPSPVITLTTATTVVKMGSAFRKKRGQLLSSPSRDEMGQMGNLGNELSSPLSRSRSAAIDDSIHYPSIPANSNSFQDAIQVFGTTRDLSLLERSNTMNNNHNLSLTTPSFSTTINNNLNNNNNNNNSEDVFPDVNSPTAASSNGIQYHIDEANCKILRICVGSVTNVAFSANGAQVIATAEDGSVHLLTTTRQSLDLIPDPLEVASMTANSTTTGASSFSGTATTAATANTIGPQAANNFYLMEKQKMTAIRTKLSDLETNIEQSKKDFEIQMNKTLERKDKQFHEIETKLKKEIQKREDAIIAGRKDYLTMRKEMQEQIEQLQHYSQEALSTMEMNYEKRLSQEALYLEKMKQAYDEYVVHAKMDMLQLHDQTDQKISTIEAEKKKLVEDMEKQKAVVLKYYDYVKDRNQEILTSLEEQQVEERLQMKTQLTTVATKLAEAQAQNMTLEVQAGRTIQRLKVDIEHKEMEIMRVNADIDWANDRIQKLEQALTQATTELKIRSELVEKSEGKLGELQQKVDDLERIRKTLTTQVHLLQSQLDPKEKELGKIREKMQELSREYDISLHAITEKESNLGQKNENLALLQKQVRELRMTLGQREAALRRAATFFEEFIYSCHSERFLAKKKIPLALLSKTAAPQPVQPATQKTTNKDTNPISHNNTQEEGIPKPGNLVISTTEEALHNPALKQRLAADQLAVSKTHDLVTTLNFDKDTTLKLKRLEELLKPFLDETKVDAELINDLEAVQQEQERRVQLLHRNLHVLQSSMDSIQTAAANKVLNHLVDNQTLLKEVNNLRMEVKALSAENDRLAAFLSSQAAGGAMNEFRRRTTASSPPHSRGISRDLSFNSQQLPQVGVIATRPPSNPSTRGGLGGGGGLLEGGVSSVSRPQSGGLLLESNHNNSNNNSNNSNSSNKPLGSFIPPPTGNNMINNPNSSSLSQNQSLTSHNRGNPEETPAPVVAENLFPPFPRRFDPTTNSGSLVKEEPSRHSLIDQNGSRSSLRGGKSSTSSTFQKAATSQILNQQTAVSERGGGGGPVSSKPVVLTSPPPLAGSEVFGGDGSSSQLSQWSRSLDSLSGVAGGGGNDKTNPKEKQQKNKLELGGKTAEEKIAELMNLNLQEIRNSGGGNNNHNHNHNNHMKESQSQPRLQQTAAAIPIVTPSMNIPKRNKDATRQRK